jgi:hypothetical protein
MKIIEFIGLLIILISIINGFYYKYLAKDPEYYISVILFVIGFFLFLIPKLSLIFSINKNNKRSS